MNVELREHIAINVATRQPVKIPHHRVYVDGVSVGFIGFKEASKLLLTVRRAPLEEQEIRRKVAELLGRDVESKQPPELPPEPPSEQDAHNDFD